MAALLPPRAASLTKGSASSIAKSVCALPLGLVTSGSTWRVRAQLRTFGLTSLFTVRVFGDEVACRKPHPAQLLLALRRMGVRPGMAVYVGDTPEDVQMARRAGVTSVGVIGNSPVPARLLAARPDISISRITELPKLFRRV